MCQNIGIFHIPDDPIDALSGLRKISHLRTCSVNSQVTRIWEGKLRVGCCKCNSGGKTEQVDLVAANTVCVRYVLAICNKSFLLHF
jgi:hypothetical protein